MQRFTAEHAEIAQSSSIVSLGLGAFGGCLLPQKPASARSRSAMPRNTANHWNRTTVGERPSSNACRGIAMKHLMRLSLALTGLLITASVISAEPRNGVIHHRQAGEASHFYRGAMRDARHAARRAKRELLRGRIEARIEGRRALREFQRETRQTAREARRAVRVARRYRRN